MVDMCTQTDFDTPVPIKVPQFPPPLPKRHSRASSRTSSPTLADIPELKPTEEIPAQPAEEVHVQAHKKEVHAERPTEEAQVEEPAVQEAVEEEPRPSSLARESKAFDEINLDDDDEEEEEPIIEEIHQAAAPQVITRARVVQVAKVLPPKLPPRNPFRNQTTGSSDSVHELSAHGSPAAGHSPIATPSLKGDGSSASSLSSIEGLEHVHTLLQPKSSADTIQEKDDFHSLPESPIKTMPGGF
jgi:glutaredoxin